MKQLHGVVPSRATVSFRQGRKQGDGTQLRACRPETRTRVEKKKIVRYEGFVRREQREEQPGLPSGGFYVHTCKLVSGCLSCSTHHNTLVCSPAAVCVVASEVTEAVTEALAVLGRPFRLDHRAAVVVLVQCKRGYHMFRGQR